MNHKLKHYRDSIHLWREAITAFLQRRELATLINTLAFAYIQTLQVKGIDQRALEISNAAPPQAIFISALSPQ
jgi:hypothetical protein